ncbi:hypothetical protein DICA1_C01266 [Diutina catenulata]
MTPTEFLASELFEHTGKVVTYQVVARRLDIPVADAKATIAAFLAANEPKLTANYVIAGTKSGHPTVKVVPQAVLEEEKASFEEVCETAVYSLHSTSGTFTLAEVGWCEAEQLKELPRDATKLVIKGPAKCLAVAETRGRVKTEAKKPIELGSSPVAKGGASTSASTSGTPANKDSTKDAKDSTKDASNTPKKTSTLSSMYVSRKRKADSPSATAKPASRPKLVYKSRKEEKREPRERVIVATHNEDEARDEAVDHEHKQKSKEQMAELANIFDNDDDFFSEDDKEAQEGKEEGKEGKEEKAVGKDDNEQPKEPAAEPTETTATKQDTPPDEPPLFEAEEPEEEVTQEVDEDGYIVRTKKPTKPAPKRSEPVKPRPKPATKAKGKGRQMDVASFFSKK